MRSFSQPKSWILLSLVVSFGVPSHGQEASPILAFVGEQPITQAQVDFQLGRTGAIRQVALAEATRQQAIQLIAQQRQALQTLRKLNLAADRDAVERAILDADTKPGQTVDAIVAETCERYGISEEVFLEQIAFRLSWKQYLAKHLTEANLARHFSNQPARFDGTRFRIWLVSLPVPAGQSERRSQAAEKLATFAEQAAVLDAEELKQAAGEFELEFKPAHWIRGFGDSDPSLVTALLDLQAGELTPVVHTASGVHLARLLEIEPGDRQFSAVSGEVRTHVLVFLLDHLAQQSADVMPLVANPAREGL